jgi:hypothetical protein
MRRWRHRQPGVVSEQLDDPLNVIGNERRRETLSETSDRKSPFKGLG